MTHIYIIAVVCNVTEPCRDVTIMNMSVEGQCRSTNCVSLTVVSVYQCALC